MSSSPRKTFIVSLRSQRVDVQCPFLTWPRGGKKPREKTASGHDSVFITLESSREKNKRGRAGSFPLASLYLISTTKDQTSYALTPNTVELIPTLGALFPRSGPVQDPVLTPCGKTKCGVIESRRMKKIVNVCGRRQREMGLRRGYIPGSWHCA